MNRKAIYIVVAAAVAGGLFFYFRQGAGEAEEIEYRYAAAEKGELVRSTTATGVLVALTSVDVRSKAGGTIVQLAVDAGSIVKKGDLIAILDPRDTKAIYDQAVADLQSSGARITQAEANYQLQSANAVTSVRDAEIALEQARIRLSNARIATQRTPISAEAAIESARAAYESSRQEFDRWSQVTEPQRRRDAEGALRQTEASFQAAKADLERQTDLMNRGYVAQSVVDRARSTFESARAAYDTARQRTSTLEKDLAAERRTLELALARSKAQFDDAKAGRWQIDTAKNELKNAEEAVRAAEVNLQRAKDARINNRVRASDVATAKASAVRSRVALDNAKVQLESTTVVAPRDGVVTLKYAEEGTVIPAGVSQFSERSNIVQLSDVTRLFVDCAVDEADIAQVREGQKVRIVAEAFPGRKFEGVVRRIHPAAVTTNSITAITVRVEVLASAENRLRLLPGMNATCEFITLSKPDTLLVPSQAVKREGEKTYVLVKSADPLKPERREVKVGESGNSGVEILSGLEPGVEVVVAEINIKQLRETQQRMMEAQQGGGLAGGGNRMGGRSLGGQTGAGGGSRGGGMGGGAGGGGR